LCYSTYCVDISLSDYTPKTCPGLEKNNNNNRFWIKNVITHVGTVQIRATIDYEQQNAIFSGKSFIPRDMFYPCTNSFMPGISYKI